MSNSTSEPQWQSISLRKQADRQKALHTPSSISITVPSNLLPKDPPQPSSGPQPVHQIPPTLLSAQDNHITTLPIPQLLSHLRAGKLSATSVCQAYIRRASLAHQLTNCLTEPLFSCALDRANRLDSHLSTTNTPIGPLHGLPISVKDTFNIAGTDTTLGFASLAYKPASTSAPLVLLLESLGAIIIAKTNIPQTLASLDSINNVFGRTYNPFNRLLTAGGSSGGEGVLVAMHGSAVGIGTDIGGSIRIPAMCNGVYGFKPSEGRVPYGGQGSLSVPGMSRTGVQAVAGPIARSVEDITLIMREVTKVSSLFGADCLPLDRPWPVSGNHSTPRAGSGPNHEFTIGILRSDGNCALLPPINALMDEVSTILRSTRTNINVRIIDIPTPKAWTKAQSAMSKLMGIDGGVETSKLLLATEEPLVPWMKTRFKHGGKHQPLARVAELQGLRAQLEQEMIRDVWSFGDNGDNFGRRRRTVDALICPVAAHPVPEIERWNAVGYTSSWVLFDYPAGTVPVREISGGDLQVGQKWDGGKSLGSWDEKCRELWDEEKTDRRVYLGSVLSVQCVTARLEDEKLAYVMGVVDGAVKAAQETTAGGREAKL